MELETIWPPYGVRISAGDLELRIARESDAPALIDLVLNGIHDPEVMPFAEAWTRTSPDLLPARYFRYLASRIAQCEPERWQLPFVVRHRGTVVGLQEIEATDFAVSRSAATGSWLGRGFHGHGIGTEMRRMICSFAFEVLQATEVRSSAFADNVGSQAVSRKVGYVSNGSVTVSREGLPATSLNLILRRDTFIAGAPITVTGESSLLAFLKI